MPSLSPTMKAGNVVEWKKKEGDLVKAGDTIASIETDKATVDFEVQEQGYLAKILVPAGTKDIAIGQLVAIMVDDKKDVSAFANFQSQSASQQPKQQQTSPTPQQQASPTSQQQAPPSNSQSANYPSHNKLSMPSLSPTMKAGNVLEWKKKEGDLVKAGDTIASIETDKATVDFEVQEQGYLAKILVPAGTREVAIGQLVAIMVDDKNDVPAFASYVDGAAPTSSPKASANSTQQQSVQTPIQNQPSSNTGNHAARVFASPLAKKVAGESNINLSSIQGTGPNNRIIKQDVLDFISSGASQQQTVSQPQSSVSQEQGSAPQQPPTIKQPSSESGEWTDIELSQMRKVIAERLLFSKTSIPHFYISSDIEMDNILKIREKLNKHAKVKISINDIIIKAASLAAIRHPDVNSSWQGNSIRRYKNVDMSVAVQTDIGLITPIIFSSNLKGLEQISTEMKSLADKAKNKKLKPQEFQGGTFTISNMGMFGITNFSAIINPPQACILAVGTTNKRVLVDENSTNKEAPFRVANVMSCTLSCDHRVVDGVLGAHWVNEFKRLMENPELLLL